jgi:hypothetical protein
MTDINITKKGEVIKSIKLPNTVTMPVMYGAVCAGLGATIGVIAGAVKGVLDDGKSVIDLIKK